MKRILLGLILSVAAVGVLALGVRAQDVGSQKIEVSLLNDEADGLRMVSMPDVFVPEEAKATGLGGQVMVKARVGQTGVVLDAQVTYGPTGICVTANRADVAAIRHAAEDAARRATFKPFMGEQEPQERTALVMFFFPAGHPGSARMISGGVLNGKAVQLGTPEYPPAARAVRASGDVNVKVVIDTDGSVFSADASAGHPLLKIASETAACASRFAPTLLNGVPVKISGVIVYNFVP